MPPAEDRISKLPNELLCHILSFLPSSQIALTSLLSKRWNRVWLAMPKADRISALPVQLICRILSLLPFEQLDVTSLVSKRWRGLRLTDINIDDRPHLHDEIALLNYHVSVMCYFHRLKPTLNTLTFVSATPSCKNPLRLVLYRVKVEHLNISYLDNSCFNLPYIAFTISTLVEINLNGLTIDYVHTSATNLPNLKILHFTNVHILKLKFLVKLLSVCPLLEDLLFQNLQVTDNTLPDGPIEELLKPFPKLLKLDISDSDLSCSMLPLKLFYNVAFLRTQVTQQSLEQDFSATRFLNLTHLELSFEDKYYWNWLIEFIRGCPIIQCLVICKIGGGYGLLSDDDVQNWLDPQFVPECLSSQLQMFSFRNYGGKQSDLQFVNYIIQNARILRNVTIYRNNNSLNPLEDEEQQMIKELHLCQRGSDLCQLHFE